MKHTVYAATFVPAEVEIPDACPDCGADFHAQGALIEGNWQDCTVRSHLEPRAPRDPALTLEPEGDTKYGDTYYPSGVLCAHCDWSLMPPAPETAP
jgi:hypothetical protein